MDSKICKGYKRDSHVCFLSDFYPRKRSKDGLDRLCKECKKAQSRDNRKPLEYRREKFREWREKHKERENELSKLEHRRMRESVIRAYGAVCVCCGFDDIRFITLDHVNNDGAEHRKSINNRNIYRWARQNNYPNTLQLLCFNCNGAKGNYKGICPHQLDKLKQERV